MKESSCWACMRLSFHFLPPTFSSSSYCQFLAFPALPFCRSIPLPRSLQSLALLFGFVPAACFVSNHQPSQTTAHSYMILILSQSRHCRTLLLV